MTAPEPIRIDTPYQVIEVNAPYAIVKIRGPMALALVTGHAAIVDFPEGSKNLNGGVAPEAIRHLQECNAELLGALQSAVADRDQCGISADEMGLEWVETARAAIARSKA